MKPKEKKVRQRENTQVKNKNEPKTIEKEKIQMKDK